MKQVIKKINRNHVRELFVYGMVGGVSWVVQTVLYVLLIRTHVFPSVSMMIGCFAGFITAYFGHIRFTFRKSHKFSHSEFVKFLVTSGVGFVINVGGVRFIIKVLELDPHYGIIPTIFTPGITFLISKFWVFK
jgi:putative flippase GtrA